MNRQTMTTSTMLHDINRHIESEQFREQRLWSMRNGEFVTEVDGKLMSESLFNQLYPVYSPVTFRQSKTNIDSTTNWIQ